MGAVFLIVLFAAAISALPPLPPLPPAPPGSCASYDVCCHAEAEGSRLVRDLGAVDPSVFASAAPGGRPSYSFVSSQLHCLCIVGKNSTVANVVVCPGLFKAIDYMKGYDTIEPLRDCKCSCSNGSA